ncbi:hypothetical protein [uncultured Chryseobacterium sp.]|uniref:hypothetical protein n=1 Tax=uncultured Chryseobacterium sp. TaxID=259322 RepID=UPI0025FCE130|nr:hypothetical protein [uncultured Chryseobacterium sp.]
MKKREVKRPEREVFAGQVGKEPGTCFPLYLFRHRKRPARKKDAAAIRANNKGPHKPNGFPKTR